MKELSFYPTDDLIDELEKRYPHYVFVGERKSTKSNDLVLSKYYNGDTIKCMGLCRLIQGFIEEEHHKKTTTIKSEDI